MDEKREENTDSNTQIFEEESENITKKTKKPRAIVVNTQFSESLTSEELAHGISNSKSKKILSKKPQSELQKANFQKLIERNKERFQLQREHKLEKENEKENEKLKEYEEKGLIEIKVKDKKVRKNDTHPLTIGKGLQENIKKHNEVLKKVDETLQKMNEKKSKPVEIIQKKPAVEIKPKVYTVVDRYTDLLLKSKRR